MEARRDPLVREPVSIAREGTWPWFSPLAIRTGRDKLTSRCLSAPTRTRQLAHGDQPRALSATRSDGAGTGNEATRFEKHVATSHCLI